LEEEANTVRNHRLRVFANIVKCGIIFKTHLMPATHYTSAFLRDYLHRKAEFISTVLLWVGIGAMCVYFAEVITTGL
jgi:hypothetical protein